MGVGGGWWDTLVRSEGRTTVAQTGCGEAASQMKKRATSPSLEQDRRAAGMTTWACPLCSCVMRQTGTRKQFRDAVVNHNRQTACGSEA